MSQSPTDPLATHQAMRYKQGWRALNRLLHEDFSFSGRERNCAFLNVDGTHFAEVASVTGLDLADDSRAVVASDWDFDGDLDLWLTARTAPRLRFMLNRQNGGNHFVAIRLFGDGDRTNRDAIGSRVEVYVDQGDRPFVTKTLHAGDSFLSQTSAWIHAGLGQHSRVDRVIVHWPGAEREVIRNVEPDAFNHIHQGTELSKPWIPPSRQVPLANADVPIPSESDHARIVLPFRLLLPRLSAFASKRDSQEVDIRLQGPTIVNLWSSHCVPCLEELAQWSESAEAFHNLGVSVIALNTDRLDDSAEASDDVSDSGSSSGLADAEKLLQQLNVPFPWRYATRRSVQNLDCFQRGVMDRWQPLPVPCSFLIDEDGCVAVIYRGRVEAEQIIKDLVLLDATADERRLAGQPFPGRWLFGPPSPTPLQVSQQMIDRDDVAEAVGYLQRYVQLVARQSGDLPEPHYMADVHFVLGVFLSEAKRPKDAIRHLKQAVAINSEDFRVQLELGELQAKVGDHEDAETALSAAVRINPNRADAHYALGLTLLKRKKVEAAVEHLRLAVKWRDGDGQLHADLANALRASEDWGGAIKHYQLALDDQPDLLLAANNLAWILSTHPNDKYRDGDQAVRRARRACQQTRYQHPVLLDTLAVALAESSDFDAAVQYETQAVDLGRRRHLPAEQIQRMTQRLDGFRQGQPFRESD